MSQAETKYVTSDLERNFKKHYKKPEMDDCDAGYNAGFKEATILAYMALADDEYEWHIEKAREHADSLYDSNNTKQEKAWSDTLESKHRELITKTVNSWIK